ncbi:hypothetical protein GQ55_6G086400 [Panicum hallii var. hallii]|uniref:Uncharacterized protein n=1 Tax=Panicum hallii var. hallii TaxID=1504633 RepID=A0A2T7D5F2_9POAL|nr:hypothetical protein GQ55_6G086400 [Panicum hallii var. hallii]
MHVLWFRPLPQITPSQILARACSWPSEEEARAAPVSRRPRPRASRRTWPWAAAEQARGPQAAPERAREQRPRAGQVHVHGAGQGPARHLHHRRRRPARRALQARAGATARARPRATRLPPRPGPTRMTLLRWTRRRTLACPCL